MIDHGYPGGIECGGDVMCAEVFGEFQESVGLPDAGGLDRATGSHSGFRCPSTPAHQSSSSASAPSSLAAGSLSDAANVSKSSQSRRSESSTTPASAQPRRHRPSLVAISRSTGSGLPPRRTICWSWRPSAVLAHDEMFRHPTVRPEPAKGCGRDPPPSGSGHEFRCALPAPPKVRPTW